MRRHPELWLWMHRRWRDAPGPALDAAPGMFPSAKADSSEDPTAIETSDCRSHLAPNWLGDAIMALPAIRDVRRHFSGQPLTVAARPSIAPVFRAVPGIDRIIVLERGKEASQLRGDIGILLPNSFRSAWILKQAGVKERWGYRSDFRRPLLTRSVPKPRGRVSFPEYYSNLVRQLGIETGPLTAQLQAPAAAHVPPR